LILEDGISQNKLYLEKRTVNRKRSDTFAAAELT
jgi:hypothetical protein